MRELMLSALAMVALPAVAAGPAKPPAAKPVTPGTFVEWTAANGLRAWTSGGVTATLTVRRKPDSSIPVITVSAPGMIPLRIEAEENFGSSSVYVGIGSLKTGEKPSVIVQSWTGGAHCCMHVAVASPIGGAFRLIDLDSWDGDQIAWPRDVSGDGVADFVFRDQRFLYAFGSYAGSWPPPLVLNLRGLKSVDVSKEPAFRPLYAAEIDEVRKACLEGDELSAGACAGYLADAARLGQFDAAWAKVTRTKVDTSTMRAFLRDHGYIG